ACDPALAVVPAAAATARVMEAAAVPVDETARGVRDQLAERRDPVSQWHLRHPRFRRMPAAPLRRNREFVALWVGQALSTLGISISSFAYPLVVLDATGSPAQAGLVGSVPAGSTFFLPIPAGALV